MDEDLSLVVLIRGNERYIFVFDQANRIAAMKMFLKFAADPELSFNWYDASVLSQKVKAFIGS